MNKYTPFKIFTHMRTYHVQELQYRPEMSLAVKIQTLASVMLDVWPRLPILNTYSWFDVACLILLDKQYHTSAAMNSQNLASVTCVQSENSVAENIHYTIFSIHYMIRVYTRWLKKSEVLITGGKTNITHRTM